MIISFLKKMIELQKKARGERRNIGTGRMDTFKNHNSGAAEFAAVVKDAEEYIEKCKTSGESSKYFAKGIGKKTARDVAVEIFNLLEIPVPLESVPIPEMFTPQIWNNDEEGLVEFLSKGVMKDAIIVNKSENVESGRFAGMKRTGFMGMYKIKDLSKPVFCAHIDVVGNDRTFKDKNLIKAYKDGGETLLVREGKDGYSTLLGADDRAGVQIIYNMILAGNDINYILTTGEENCGVGSKYLIDNDAFLTAAKDGFIICLDRKGGSDLLDKSGSYCNLDLFDAAVTATKIDGKEQLFRSDAVWCDADVFSEAGIPCLNMSVGYQNAHSGTESLVVKWFEKAYVNALNMEKNLRGPFKKVEKSRGAESLRSVRGAGGIDVVEFVEAVSKNPKMTIEEYLKIINNKKNMSASSNVGTGGRTRNVGGEGGGESDGRDLLHK